MMPNVRATEICVVVFLFLRKTEDSVSFILLSNLLLGKLSRVLLKLGL